MNSNQHNLSINIKGALCVNYFQFSRSYCLYVTIAFGQAAVNIPFSGTDGTTTIPLAVGLDLTATNCIDPDLGESDLPPFPPAGVFDIRFDLAPYGCPTLSTAKDYRKLLHFHLPELFNIRYGGR